MEIKPPESQIPISPIPESIAPQNPQNNSDDISRRTIVVLLVLVTVLSVLGTWMVLNEVSQINAPAPPPKEPAVGQVKFTILDPNAPPPPTEGVSLATGRVAFEIRNE